MAQPELDAPDRAHLLEMRRASRLEDWCWTTFWLGQALMACAVLALAAGLFSDGAARPFLYLTSGVLAGFGACLLVIRRRL
jgi:hypothetical protein